MARLIQTEQALMDTRQQVATVPKVCAPLVDTRTIGKALTFTGEHEDWPEWSFQFTTYMEFANLKPIVALRWALAWALLCKGSAQETAKNTEVNNGLEAWRGLNATCDSDN